MKQTLEVVLSFMCVHFDSIVLFYSFLNKKLAFFLIQNFKKINNLKKRLLIRVHHQVS